MKGREDQDARTGTRSGRGRSKGRARKKWTTLGNKQRTMPMQSPTSSWNCLTTCARKEVERLNSSATTCNPSDDGVGEQPRPHGKRALEMSTTRSAATTEASGCTAWHAPWPRCTTASAQHNNITTAHVFQPQICTQQEPHTVSHA
jgi:hypothetical protein